MTVVETMPPDHNMLKFLLERRMPDKYREIKDVQHTHNAGALFQAFLKRMDEAKKAELPIMLEAQVVEVDLPITLDGGEGVSHVLAQDQKTVENQGLDPDREFRGR